VTDLSLLPSLLLGAIVSSTDAAAVFSILESKKLRLKEHTDTTIEFESATNDPMAMLLTLGITMLILNPSVSPHFFGLFFVKQVGLGAAAGLLFGRLAVWLLQHVTFEEKGLVPIFVLACMLMATLGGERLGGNRLIASYIMGVILGNREFPGKDQSRLFFNSTAWLSEDNSR
jgi:cell volume regulation protein A